MNIGEKLRGGTVVEICGSCQLHPDENIVRIFIPNGGRKRRPWYNQTCPECYREKQRAAKLRYQERNPINGKSIVREGVKETEESLWDPIADKKIEEFWKSRGIDPERKFRYRIAFHKKT